MRKFSKIVESRSELFSRLSTTQEDIEEALVDLSDNGYDIDIEDIYISPSGKVHYDTVGVPEYYSALRIDIKRPSTSIENSMGDVRNWDGSVYYEKDINILESIYHSITRLKSTFSGKAEVYYCFRSVNTISISVIFNIETGKSVINFEDVSEYMNSLSNYTTHRIFSDNYLVEVTGSSGDKSKSVKISIPRKDYMDHGVNFANPKDEIDRIVRSIIDDNKPDNKYQLKKVFDLYVKKLFQKSNITGKLSIVTQFDEVVFMNTETKEPVIKIDSWYDEYSANNKVMTKKGVFKNEYKTFDIYQMSLTVNFIRK